MAFTSPKTFAVAEVLTSPDMNTYVRDNTRYLKGLDGATTFTAGIIITDGAGNYVRLPTLTTTQRDALTPVNGMIIYNSTLTQLQKYENAVWADFAYKGNLAAMLIASQATGDLLYASSATAWARLGIGAEGYFVKSVSGVPAWALTLTVFNAGDVLMKSADTERTTASLTYVKVKEILVNRTGTLRIKFDIAGGDAGSRCYGRIYRNGVAVGTERIVDGATYETFTQDIAGWAVADLAQVYYKFEDIGGGGGVKTRNFRIYADNAEWMTVNTD